MHIRESFFLFVGFIVATCASAFAMPSPDGGISANLPRQMLNPCGDADNPNVNASVQLQAWVECAVNGFFPYPANGAWDKEFERVFSKDLRATFNSTKHSYNTWLSLYKNFNNSLLAFNPFNHGFTSVIAVPDSFNSKGGFVSLTGWEGGYHSALKRDLWYSDFAFAVVQVDAEGKRKIVEFREATNMPNTSKLPAGYDWACAVPYAGHGGNESVGMNG